MVNVKIKNYDKNEYVRQVVKELFGIEENAIPCTHKDRETIYIGSTTAKKAKLDCKLSITETPIVDFDEYKDFEYKYEFSDGSTQVIESTTISKMDMCKATERIVRKLVSDRVQEIAPKTIAKSKDPEIQAKRAAEKLRLAEMRKA